MGSPQPTISKCASQIGLIFYSQYLSAYPTTSPWKMHRVGCFGATFSSPKSVSRRKSIAGGYYTLVGTRTQNLQIRSLARYPLRHKSTSISLVTSQRKCCDTYRVDAANSRQISNSVRHSQRRLLMNAVVYDVIRCILCNAMGRGNLFCCSNQAGCIFR